MWLGTKGYTGLGTVHGFQASMGVYKHILCWLSASVIYCSLLIYLLPSCFQFLFTPLLTKFNIFETRDLGVFGHNV